jgi:hypothetical protein
VSGYTLSWTRVGGIGTYILRREVAGQAAHFTVVHGTSVTPPPVPAIAASYSVRTAVESSTWTPSQSISYPEQETADPQAAPAIVVSGATLTWNAIAGVKAYILVTKIPGQAAQYSEVTGDSVTPEAVPGASVEYSVRTAVEGSAWAPVVTISYQGEPSSPGKGTGGTEEATGPSGSSPEPGGEQSSLVVGVVGLVAGGQAQVETFKKTLHTRYMRLDAGNGGSGWYASDMPSFITEVVTKYGVTPLILYNPAESGKETLVGRPVATVRAEVKALGEVMHGLGLKWMEFGNEEYFYEQPGEYARQYMAAMEGLAGLGITLIPDSWGDYWNNERGAEHGYWSQVRNGGGWWLDFVNDVKSLGGALPAACSLHPYGPMTGHEYFGAGGGPSGWMSVPAMHSWMVEKHVAAPIWITEVGGESYGTEEVDSEAQMAADTSQYVKNADAWPYVQGLFIYSIMDGPTQGVGLFSQLGTPKQAAFAFGEAVASLGLGTA